MALVKVAKASDVPAGSIKGFVVEGRKVAVANANGRLYAFEDRCAHAGQPLSNGLLIGNIVMCISHGAQFDLATGKPLTMIAKDPIKVFPVKTEGDDILVDL
jgi:3-phenylpropionate/trans-cinnamate dioxygenase ferredoxin subunit